MGLEVATYINQLVATNPVGATDPVSQGDDHLRLLKAVLLATLPALGGAVTSTHTELSQLHGGVLTSLGDGALAAPTYAFASDTNTGMYRVSADFVGFAAGGVYAGGFTVNTGVGQYQAPDGSQTIPAISFAGDTNTGMYRVAADTLGWSTNGVVRTTLSTTVFATNLTFNCGDGNVGNPGMAFLNDSDTGWWSIASGAIGFSSNGVEKLRIGNALNLNDGSAGSPAYTFTSDPDTGFWRAGANQFQAVVGGQTVAQFYLNGVVPQLLVADGSAAAPSFSFNNDLDTGVYRSAADTYDIVCGGVSVATFDNVTAGVGQIRFRRQLYLDVGSAGSATAGAATALPANPVGYIAVTINGTQRRIPYYGN